MKTQAQVTPQMDAVSRYASSMGLAVGPRTVLVEGTTDVALFELAAQLYWKETSKTLLGDELKVVAAGIGEQGGTRGIIRELLCLRGLSRTCLLPNGQQRYRFMGLFDNDRAGQHAVRSLSQLDTSILEYKDVFRLWPVMPLAGNLDPRTVQKSFERENGSYSGLEWEAEDLLPMGFVEAFLSENEGVLIRKKEISGKVHHEFTRDGKAFFHRYVKINAVVDDLRMVIDVLKAIRHYFNLPRF